MDMIRTAVNVSGDATVSSIVAKSEGKMDVSIFNDPDAGTLNEEDFHLDEAIEAEMQEAIEATHSKE